MGPDQDGATGTTVRRPKSELDEWLEQNREKLDKLHNDLDSMVKDSKELLEDLAAEDNFEDHLPEGEHGPFSLDESSKGYMMPGKNSKKDWNIAHNLIFVFIIVFIKNKMQ